jgi:hypothetical protein
MFIPLTNVKFVLNHFYSVAVLNQLTAICTIELIVTAVNES